jgi:hypothetical protein
VIDCGSLEFAQARLQSRHGGRASEAAWQRLETAREFGALLEAARASPLRPWLVGITTPGEAHRIESVLRAHWRAAVTEVAGWMPAAWQPAVLWCAAWPALPVLQHLARGGAPAAWMDDDPDFGALCAAPSAPPPSPPAAWRAGSAGRPASMAYAWHPWERRAATTRRRDQPEQVSDAARTAPRCRAARPGWAAASVAAGAADAAVAARHARAGGSVHPCRAVRARSRAAAR